MRMNGVVTKFKKRSILKKEFVDAEFFLRTIEETGCPGVIRLTIVTKAFGTCFLDMDWQNAIGLAADSEHFAQWIKRGEIFKANHKAEGSEE